MSDSFINKLVESTTLKGSDYAAFDIADPNTGGFYTKKVKFDTLTTTVKNEVIAQLQAQIDALQTSLNLVAQSISNKLDKNGLSFSPTERMNGTLSVNASLCALQSSHFNNTVNVHNNFISNVKDPVQNYDAVNLHTVNDKIAALNIPNTANYLLKSGDTMTTGTPLILNAHPTSTSNALQAATKKFVEDNKGNGLFIPLSGGTMNSTTPLLLNVHPTDGSNDLQAASKKYVLDHASAGNYLPLSGGELTGSVIIKGFSEKSSNSSGTSGNVTLNLNNGNTFAFNITGDINGFLLAGTQPTDSYSITLFIKQTGTYNVTNWTIGGTAVNWAGGIVPTLTKISNKTDVFAFTKIGTSWYGFVGGLNY